MGLLVGGSTTTYDSVNHNMIYTKPAGTQEKDIMLVQLAGVDRRNYPDNFTKPDGWTELFVKLCTQNYYLSIIYWKEATASEPSTYTWGMPVAGYFSGIIVTYRGYSIDNYDGTLDDFKPQVTPSIAVAKNGSRAALFYGSDYWDALPWTISSATKLYEYDNGDNSLAMAEKEVDAGTLAGISASVHGLGAYGTSQVIILAPLTDICWGADDPIGQNPLSWQEWEISAGVKATVTGDANWGQIAVSSVAAVFGPVVDSADANSKTATLELNKYGTGSGNVTVKVRQASSMSDRIYDKNDASWTDATDPLFETWRYWQAMMEYAA